jgi:hypothetical protein
MSSAAAHRCVSPARSESETAAWPASPAERLIAARTFCVLATTRRVRRAFADAEHVSDGLVDRVVLELDDGMPLIVRAHVIPANGRPTSAALLLEVADDPLSASTADKDALADALTGARITRVHVTGHPHTSTPYAVLLVLDDQRQVAVETYALPMTAGSPLMTFCTVAHVAQGKSEALDTFDGSGRLVS